MSETPQPDPAGTAGFLPVRLLGLPVGLWSRADDEGKDLMREFALIVLDRTRHQHEIPHRLLELIDELQASYGNLGGEQTALLAKARREGVEAVDLEYRLPPGIEGDLVRLGTMLDEADEYCRRGDHLLSLASSPASKAFRDWFIEEICRQLGGSTPVPFPESSYAKGLEGATAQ